MDLEEIVLSLILLFVVAFLLASCFVSETPSVKKFIYLYSVLHYYSMCIQENARNLMAKWALICTLVFKSM